MIAPFVEELAGQWAGKVKVVKLDIDENPEIADRYGIRSIPTLLLFQDGKVVGQRVGAAPKSGIEQFVDANIGVKTTASR
jgi:thioredoxin 1